MSSRTGGRLLLEFTIVVAGVLAALAGEAWWSGRQARAYEAELRGDFVEEFRRNAAILAQDIEFNEGDLVALRSLAELDGEGFGELLLAATAATGAGFDPAMGSARSLIESGDLAVITERSLRLRLAEWGSLLDEHQRFNQNYVEFFMGQLLPRLAIIGADKTFSQSERTEARILLRNAISLLEGVLDSQLRLLASAEGMLAALEVPLDR